MNQDQEIGVIIMVIAVLLSLLTPAFWCFFGNADKITCCAPIMFNSCLFISGVIVLVLGSN